ncbi:MAG: large-conductance mechanosensitive channel protein MscL [Bacilli bacterium]|nr:large-conductance mechanosensitive channel protein MscL [Bacilli bacterium]MBQ6539026.1 large-conductance mechanosensitive channel protein MscL [Bacilli bacterium]
MAKKVIDKDKGVKSLKKGASEFKEFISRGNVVDMAVGVIIGAAFGKIVTSLVDDILMPAIGALIGGLDFTKLSATVGSAHIKYGVFIQSVVDFLIVAFCIFLVIKLFEKFKRKEEETAAPSDEVVVLEEIRDLLKNK